MATPSFKSTAESVMADTISTIKSLTGITREILEVAQIICTCADANRDKILYDLLLRSMPSAPSPSVPSHLMNIACLAIDHATNQRAPMETARRLFPLISAITESNARVMDAFRESLAREKMYLTFARNCAPIERDLCQLAGEVERIARTLGGDYSCEKFDAELESAIDERSAIILANYPDDVAIDRAAFATLYKKFTFDVEREPVAELSMPPASVLNLIETARKLHALVGDDPKLNDYAIIAAQRVRESRAPTHSDA